LRSATNAPAASSAAAVTENIATMSDLTTSLAAVGSPPTKKEAACCEKAASSATLAASAPVRERASASSLLGVTPSAHSRLTSSGTSYGSAMARAFRMGGTARSWKGSTVENHQTVKPTASPGASWAGSAPTAAL